jgi:hypothetical protein
MFNMFTFASVGHSKFVKMHGDVSHFYPSTLIFYTRHRVTIKIYRTVYLHTYIHVRVSVWCRSWADNLRIRREIIWHCCQNDRLFQNKWPKRPTHATYASDTWSSILQFVHNLFWLKLKWNARSKLFYFIIYRSSMLWWSSRTLTKLKSQSQKRFNEWKYQYLKYKNKNHSGPDT